MSAFSHGRSDPRHRTGLVVVVVMVVATLVVATFLLLGSDGTGGNQAVRPVSTASPTTSTSTPVTPLAPSPSETSTTVAPSPTTADALAQLETFFAAAARMDAQLLEAAQQINGEGPPWPTFSAGAARAVRAADLHVVAETVPGGMPEPLLQSVLAVYHDLAARRAAMNEFSFSWTYDPVRESPNSRSSTKALLSYLANGASPAARFDADVATAKAHATSTAAFTRAPLGDRADMETYLRLEMIFKANFGCDAHGSPEPLTGLPPIVWTSESTGTIGAGAGAPEFEIRLEPEGAYTEDPIKVC